MVFRALSTIVLAAVALSPWAVAPGWGQSTQGSPGLPPLQQPQRYTTVHVNAASGRNDGGDGSQLRPWQTISHALQAAPPNSIILLAPGDYSEASGEQFPLVLRPGVTVQGAITPGINQAVIHGNGVFPSANGTYMQVTVVAADGAGLGHVTITNPSSSGYGLLIESGSPVIRGNHFIGNGYGGAYVAGSGAPLLEQNLFANNGSVGVVIAGQSRAEIRGNTFDNTGTGIQVTPGAEPRLSNNRL
jgi:parallel beta-helix repeat protein